MGATTESTETIMAAPYVKEFLGVGGCRHVGTKATVKNGRKLLTYRLEWCGGVATKCPECGSATAPWTRDAVIRG